MKSRPLVSIIINNYNYAPYVEQAIRSALSQDYEPIEVIVVDDGSTDSSAHIINGFANIVHSVFKANEGQASAFNVGFNRSQGDIVLFLDSDDLLALTAVTKAVQVFKTSEVIKVHWPLWEIDCQGVQTGQLIPREELASGFLRDEVIETGRIGANHSPTSGNAWSRSFLEQVLPIDETGDKHGADGALRLLASVYGLIGSIKEPLGSYRLHSHNFSGGQGNLFSFERDYRRAPAYFRLLAAHLTRLGIPFHERRWYGPDSYYAWSGKIRTARLEIEAVIPAQSVVVLVDQCDLGADLLPNLNVRPFIERNAVYGGPPRDDFQANEELDQVITAGAQFIVIVFPAFWWLEHYATFHARLRADCNCIWETEHVVIFQIRKRCVS